MSVSYEIPWVMSNQKVPVRVLRQAVTARCHSKRDWSCEAALGERSFLCLGPHLSSTCCIFLHLSLLFGALPVSSPSLRVPVQSVALASLLPTSLCVCVRFFWLTIKMPHPWNSLCLGMCLTHLFKILADSGRLCYGYITEIMANTINIWKLVKLVQRMKH